MGRKLPHRKLRGTLPAGEDGITRPADRQLFGNVSVSTDETSAALNRPSSPALFLPKLFTGLNLTDQLMQGPSKLQRRRAGSLQSLLPAWSS